MVLQLLVADVVNGALDIVNTLNVVIRLTKIYLVYKVLI